LLSELRLKKKQAVETERRRYERHMRGR
jgi:hypothetical protein